MRTIEEIRGDSINAAIKKAIPFSIGDAVYVICKRGTKSPIVDVGYIQSYEFDGQLSMRLFLYGQDLHTTYGMYGFGKDIFLTRPEAEAAMKGGGE